MKSVEQALKAPASELMRAARRPATTRPRTPAGRIALTIKGKAAWAASGMALPAASTMEPRAGALPVRARASAIMPGTMKIHTGRSFRYEAKIAPRRACRSFGAPRARCTMYWSVVQYHRPMIGAQKSMPSHG